MLSDRIALIGYGVSNKAVYEYLKGLGCRFVIRTPNKTDTPDGVINIYGDGYLDTKEELVFRSPSCLPHKIKGRGHITQEAAFALSNIMGKHIAVTGSDGKTTVATLIHKILSGGMRAYLGGNIGYPLINYIGRIGHDDVLVMELSSFQLADLHPKTYCSVITGITPNHLDVHPSYRHYIDSKANALVNTSRAVLNFDNNEVRQLIKRVPRGARLVLASLGDIGALMSDNSDVVYVKDEYIYYNDERIMDKGSIKLRGDFNVLNVCLAIGATYELTDRENIRRGVSEFHGVSGRMELIARVHGVEYYDSSIDSTPSRTSATLSAFDKRRCIVILGGYDKNLTYECLGDTMRGVKHAVICGANSAKIERAIRGRCAYTSVGSFTEAVLVSSHIAEEGDAVILSPASASYDMFDNYRQRSEKYKEIVRGL